MIFDFKDATSWDPVVSNVLGNILGPHYPDTVIKNAEKIKYTDSDYEACELFSELASREQLREAVTNEISRNFKEVMAYHACRPSQVDDYYEKGIMPLSPLEAQKQFRDYFSSFVSQEDIDTAIAEVSLETRDGVAHVVLDDRVFIESSGHYLIYGGEYQNCLAIHLPGASERTRDILKQIGKATVLVCRLPFSTIADIEYLVSLLLADHFFRMAHKRNDVTVIDYTLVLHETIQPEAIARHYAPIRIVDPFKQRAVWNDETMEYE